MIKINYNMSAEEIEEYMKTYLIMMLAEHGYPYKEGDSRLETNWYVNWKKTGVMDPNAMSYEQLLKLKNKRYQLKKGNLDQSFIIWRLMKQEQDKINIKLDEALKQNKVITTVLHNHALSIKQ